MRPLRSGVLLLGLAAGASAASTNVVAVKAGRLIDPRAGRMVPNAVVLIENGRVKAAGPSVPIPAGATIIDLTPLTVLPGLIDCHTHLVGDPNDADPLTELKKSAAQRAFESIPNARATLQAGFTTVRDVGVYRAFVDVALRDAIEKGWVEGPRMFVAGPYVTISQGGGAVTGFAPDVALPWDLRFGQADGADQVRQRVREIAAHGVDLIKVIATGAFLTHGSNPASPEYTPEELRAAVEEARKKGLRVAAHAHDPEGIKNAVRAGVASIEHGTYLDDEGIRLMKEHGTFLVADIYDDEWIRGQAAQHGMPQDFIEKEGDAGRIQRENFRKAVRAGVKIAYGTDAGVYPHGDNARQFAYQVRYGQTSMEAIRSATIAAAELIGREQEIGSLEPGRSADLIAVAQDPLEDVRALENVSFVMKEGRVYKDAR